MYEILKGKKIEAIETERRIVVCYQGWEYREWGKWEVLIKGYKVEPM